MKKLGLFILTSLFLVMASCSNQEPAAPTDKDKEENVDFTTRVDIQFNGDQISINNPVAPTDILTEDLPNEVKITSNIDQAEFYISGTATGKAVRIYSLHKCKVVLNNLSLNSGQQPAINIQTKKRCYLVVEGNNFLADEFGYPTNNNPGPLEGDPTPDGEDKKGTFFAEGQVIMSGNGTLTIQGNNKHAFATEQYFRVRSGNLKIENAVSCGIRAKEYFWQEGGSILMTGVLNKGIKVSEGYITIGGGVLDITSLNDGIVASYGSNPLDPEIVPTPVCDITIHAGNIRIQLLKENKPQNAYAIRTFKGATLLQNGTIDITKHPNAMGIVGETVPGNTVVTYHDL